jgi:hypothetical protein
VFLRNKIQVNNHIALDTDFYKRLGRKLFELLVLDAAKFLRMLIDAASYHRKPDFLLIKSISF